MGLNVWITAGLLVLVVGVNVFAAFRDTFNTDFKAVLSIFKQNLSALKNIDQLTLLQIIALPVIISIDVLTTLVCMPYFTLASLITLSSKLKPLYNSISNILEWKPFAKKTEADLIGSYDDTVHVTKSYVDFAHAVGDPSYSLGYTDKYLGRPPHLKPNPKKLNKASKTISKLTKKKPSKKFFDDIEKTKHKPSKSLKK